ncbi:hypothetical protein M514_08256 [Trichuris suis]|uniref:Uncharacterized protein n=1 Tax=Trichuris suis TaxID=68888 RepID=A0A085M0S2_9BILA|nr:hypothetical protein M513_08256 [Trichuris suis]KFD68898.1 hypothetical protein M514_08256 [Trichuris suis]
MNSFQRMANFLRQRWTVNKGSDCKTDILVILAYHFMLCHKGKVISLAGTNSRPLTTISLSSRLRSVISEQKALGALLQRLRSPTATNESFSPSMTAVLKVVQGLNDIMPLPMDRIEADGYNFSLPKSSPILNETQSTGQPSIPLWAIILFGVSILVTCVCALVGHWINADVPLRRWLTPSGPRPANAGVFPPNSNPDWRAGFGGGMYHAQTERIDRVSPFFLRRPASSPALSGMNMQPRPSVSRSQSLKRPKARNRMAGSFAISRWQAKRSQLHSRNLPSHTM